MKIGVIGTGLMGSSLVKCLVSKNIDVIVYNRTRSRAEELVREYGVELASSPYEVLTGSDYTVLFIAGDQALYDIVYMDRGLASGEDGVVVNASTVTPMASLNIYKYLEKRGVTYVESPVYGSVSEASECRLLSITACSEKVWMNIRGFIEKYSFKTIYVGEIPRATVLKLALNNIGLAFPAILAESLMLLRSWGIDPMVFREVSGNLWFGEIIDRYWDRVFGEKPPRFKTWMAGKDYQYVADTLKYMKLPSHLAETISSMYMDASIHGYSDKDYPLIAKYYLELAGEK